MLLVFRDRDVCFARGHVFAVAWPRGKEHQQTARDALRTQLLTFSDRGTESPLLAPRALRDDI